MGDIFDLKKLLLKKAKDGDIKVYSFKESMKIYRKINEGLPEFQKEQSRRERSALAKKRPVFI